VRRECGILSPKEQSCDTGMIEAIIVLRIELGGNSENWEYWKRMSTVAVLVATV